VDTTLSEIQVFKLLRDEAAAGAVIRPPIAITIDIIKYRRPHYFPADKALTVNTLNLQQVLPERSGPVASDWLQLCSVKNTAVSINGYDVFNRPSLHFLS